MLAIYSLAYIARMTRSFMLDQLNQEYVLTARVKGLREGTVIWYHAFRNVLVQLITIIGLTYASLLEGSVLTETVFAWPGIGQYITNSLFNADMNAVIGGTLVVGISLRLHQHAVRYALPDRRPEGEMMSETALDQKSGSTSWLLADSPKNAFQAKCQRAYIGWMSFRSNPIAMFGLAIVLFLCFVALFAPLIAGGDGTTQDLANRLAPPSAENWFGTDELGRDIFARIVWGSRVTLYIIFPCVHHRNANRADYRHDCGASRRCGRCHADAHHRHFPGVSTTDPRPGNLLPSLGRVSKMPFSSHCPHDLVALCAACPRRNTDPAQQRIHHGPRKSWEPPGSGFCSRISCPCACHRQSSA